MNIFDEVRMLFRKQLDRMFFDDNQIISVSESCLNVLDPDDCVITVKVKDEHGTERSYEIKEVTEKS